MTDADLFQQAVKLAGGNLRAYADLPGSGPDGKRCKDCAHCSGHGYRKTFYKCLLLKPTHGSATDIRVRTPACAKFEDKNDGAGK